MTRTVHFGTPSDYEKVKKKVFIFLQNRTVSLLYSPRTISLPIMLIFLPFHTLISTGMLYIRFKGTHRGQCCDFPQWYQRYVLKFRNLKCLVCSGAIWSALMLCRVRLREVFCLRGLCSFLQVTCWTRLLVLLSGTLDWTIFMVQATASDVSLTCTRVRVASAIKRLQTNLWRPEWLSAMVQKHTYFHSGFIHCSL